MKARTLTALQGPSVRLAHLPRMADFARFGEAAGRGLGWPEEAFLAAYLANRRNATASSLEDSLIAAELLFSVKLGGLIHKTGTASRMLEQMSEGMPKRVLASSRWPKSPAMFANERRRLAPQLRERGLYIVFSRNKEARVITLTTQAASYQAELRQDCPPR